MNAAVNSHAVAGHARTAGAVLTYLPTGTRPCARWKHYRPPSTTCLFMAMTTLASRVVRIRISGRSRTRIHADALYLITDSFLDSDPDTDVCRISI